MSGGTARVLGESELQGPHLSVQRAVRAWREQQLDWGEDFPELTWEQVRAGWMAGPAGPTEGEEAAPALYGGNSPHCMCSRVYGSLRAEAEARCIQCGGSLVWFGACESGSLHTSCSCSFTCTVEENGPAPCFGDVSGIAVPESCTLLERLGSVLSGGWTSGGDDDGGGMGEPESSSCVAFGECGPLATARPGISGSLPRGINITVREYSSISAKVDRTVLLDEICNVRAARLEKYVGYAYRLLLANKDVLKYAMCVHLSPLSDADLGAGFTDMQAVFQCVCNYLDGAGNLDIFIEPTGRCAVIGEVATGEYWTDGNTYAEARSFEGGDMRVYCGIITGEDGSPTRSALLTAVKVSVSIDSPTYDLVRLAGVLGHELLHICGFKHDDPTAGPSVKDALHLMETTFVQTLAAREGVEPTRPSYP